MKVFKFIFAIIFLSTIFPQYLAAENMVAQRDGLLKDWREKGQAAKKLDAISANVTTKLDVPYLNDNSPLHKLDIYSPAQKDKPLSVLVHIHGGGWKMGDKKMMKETGMFYASQGILFITPNYRLSPEVQHPAHVEDCAAALSWVFDHVTELGGDKSRIFLSGHSAGAHLAALLGTNAAYLQKYNIEPGQLGGVISVDTASFNLLSDDNETLVKRFVKQAFGTDEKVLKGASPFYNVTDKGSYPKFLIFNTTNRESAAKGGKKFADKLKSAGCDVQFVPVDAHTHKDMATGMYDASDPVGSGLLQFILHGTNK
jgi:arylformamidase